LGCFCKRKFVEVVFDEFSPFFLRVKWMPYENVEQDYKTKVLRSYLSGQEQHERFAEDTAEGGRGRHFSN